MGLFLGLVMFVAGGHAVADNVGFPLDCNKNTQVICEYNLNN